MRYTVKQLADAAGVSPRTLHFYDQIGLLKPDAYGENGYRYYGEAALLRLQQILFFKELDFSLATSRPPSTGRDSTSWRRCEHTGSPCRSGWDASRVLLGPWTRP